MGGDQHLQLHASTERQFVTQLSLNLCNPATARLPDCKPIATAITINKTGQC